MHPLSDLKVPAGSVAIHWFEQSCFALKDSNGLIIQIDPYFPHERNSERFIHATPPLDEATLPTRYVLLTHDHRDHTCPESIQRIHAAFPECRFVGPDESISRVLRETQVDPMKTITVVEGDELKLDSMTVHVIYAKPPAGDPEANIQPPDTEHLGFVVETDGGNIYFSGDPINNFAENDSLIEAVAARKPDLGFLTTHPTEGEFPYFEGSVKMAQRIGLKDVAPSHYACFVKRDYDPQEWAAQFSADGPKTMIIPRNTHVLYSSD
ncbi:MAG: MBL fold metallo-hydrolase [Chloroflexota bacterium]